jgi:hypothetical protein
MPGGRPDAGIETNAREILGDVLRRAQALVLVGRIGRNRLDAQEIEKSFEASIEIGIDLCKYGG